MKLWEVPFLVDSLEKVHNACIIHTRATRAPCQWYWPVAKMWAMTCQPVIYSLDRAGIIAFGIVFGKGTSKAHRSCIFHVNDLLINCSWCLIGSMTQQKKADCRRCRHYYVTWDKRTPHGCRAMKFKSKMLPNIVVLRSAGHPCLLFERKIPSR